MGCIQMYGRLHKDIRICDYQDVRRHDYQTILGADPLPSPFQSCRPLSLQHHFPSPFQLSLQHQLPPLPQLLLSLPHLLHLLRPLSPRTLCLWFLRLHLWWPRLPRQPPLPLRWSWRRRYPPTSTTTPPYNSLSHFSWILIDYSNAARQGPCFIF